MANLNMAHMESKLITLATTFAKEKRFTFDGFAKVIGDSLDSDKEKNDFLNTLVHHGIVERDQDREFRFSIPSFCTYLVHGMNREKRKRH
ncbi:MAG: hypothetical protein OXC80_04145 [Gammaproteobacteria bacterium]|nr:hypothetical protein [Gammaproteobacteria bacterium]